MRTPFASSMLFSAALLLLPAGRAVAHAQLVKADPRVGSTLDHAPGRLWLRFDQVLRLGGSGVILVEPGGREVLLDPLTQDRNDIRAVVAPLPADLARGRYVVKWRALSPDGHRTQGDFNFTISG